jgi:hypothetical protein
MELPPEYFATTSPWKRMWPMPPPTTAPQAHTTTSLAWRKALDEGNAFFATAKDVTNLSVARKAAVKMALVKYNAALSLASEAHQRASANKNMFLACGLVTMDDDAEPEDRYYYFSEALSSAARAIAFAYPGGLHAEWVGTVIDKVSDLVAYSLVESAMIVSDRLGGTMQLLATVVHGPTTQPHIRALVALALLDRANKKGALAIADGDHHRGMAVVEERAALTHSAVEWCQQPECLGFYDAVLDVKGRLRNTGALAAAKRQLQHGKRLREESVVDGINMDKVFEAIDALRVGVVECHDLHIDMEAELLSEIGYIWASILKVKDAAHRAYRASMFCAHSCSPREFYSHAWFKRARDAVE